MLDLRARHILKGLLAVILVGVVALPVGNVQRVSRPRKLAVGRGLRLRRGIGSGLRRGFRRRRSFRGAAGAQSKHHDQGKDECQCFFHILSSYYSLFPQRERCLVKLLFLSAYSTLMIRFFGAYVNAVQ